MADVQAFLSRKAGPLPVWGWAALGGGLVAVLYLRGKGQTPAPATGAQNADASGQGLFAPSPIIVTPQTMPDQLSSANAPPPPPSNPLSGKGVITGGATGVFVSPSSYPNGLITVLPAGTTVTLAGSPVQGVSWGSPPSNFWQPISFGGLTGYVHSQLINISPAGQGGGGGASAVKTLPGAGRVGRFSSRHAHPQFVNVGMGGGGRSGLRAVSQRTGLPEARLMALNPGHWRPGPGGRPRHIRIR